MKRLLFLLMAALLLTACGSNDSKEESTDAEQEETKQSDDIYFDGKVAQTDEVKVEIKETKVIAPGEEGNEHGENTVFAIWYDVTNLTDEELTPIDGWVDNFEVIQDNSDDMIRKLEGDGMPDDAHLDTQMNVIKKGGTVEDSTMYKLDDEETPVTIIAKNGFLGDEIGKHDYEIK